MCYLSRMEYLPALAAGLGVALYAWLFQCIEEKQAASRRKHGRGVVEQACYRLGRAWAARHKVKQRPLNGG